ncbi:hypothetical protein FRC02_007684 [Tulasnella sp. 418]|nr:hypothetical protein FRC02_007684 [Tulasnella sp. 418]
MVPGQCFCGEPCRPQVSDHQASNSEGESDSSTDIYCSRECAITDSLKALTARSKQEDGQEWNPPTSHHLTFSSHYRRVKRIKAIGVPVEGEMPSSDTSTSSTPVSATFSIAERSEPPSSATSSVYSDLDKPLPRLPQVTSLRDSPRFQPKPGQDRTADYRRFHQRDSSLSSMADSMRFTKLSASTRATSIVSDMVEPEGMRRGHSSKPRRAERTLNKVTEEVEEEAVKQSKPTYLDKWNAGDEGQRSEKTIADHFAGFLLQTQLVTDYGDADPFPDSHDGSGTSSEYDPFELDHLLLSTPRIDQHQSGSGDLSTEATPKGMRTLRSSSVSPLRIRSTKSINSQVLPVHSIHAHTPLDPKVTSWTANSLAPKPRLGIDTSELMIRNRHLLPPSPSSFPTTPSFSPIIPSPAVSSIEKDACGTLGDGSQPSLTLESVPHSSSWTSLSNSTPIKNSAFSSHRRQRPISKRTADTLCDGSLPILSELGYLRDSNASSAGLVNNELDITAGEDALGFLDSALVVGPGNPLFLKPVDPEMTWLAKGGSSTSNAEAPKPRAGRRDGRVIDLLQAPNLSRPLSANNDDILSYYFENND